MKSIKDKSSQSTKNDIDWDLVKQFKESLADLKAGRFTECIIK